MSHGQQSANVRTTHTSNKPHHYSSLNNSALLCLFFGTSRNFKQKAPQHLIGSISTPANQNALKSKDIRKQFSLSTYNQNRSTSQLDWGPRQSETMLFFRPNPRQKKKKKQFTFHFWPRAKAENDCYFSNRFFNYN